MLAGGGRAAVKAAAAATAAPAPSRGRLVVAALPRLKGGWAGRAGPAAAPLLLLKLRLLL